MYSVYAARLLCTKQDGSVINLKQGLSVSRLHTCVNHNPTPPVKVNGYYSLYYWVVKVIWVLPNPDGTFFMDHRSSCCKLLEIN